MAGFRKIPLYNQQNQISVIKKPTSLRSFLPPNQAFMKRDIKQCHLYLPKSSELNDENKNEPKAKYPEDIEVKILNKKINQWLKRNQWLRIQCNKKVIYRVVRGATAKGLTADKIWLSYDSRKELDADERSTLLIRPCTKWERLFKAPQNSPDPFMRAQFYLSVWISLVGALTGLMGVLLAVFTIVSQK